MTAQVIVFANEKGGTGKSTLAMHAVVALLRAKKKVLTFDLDANQGTLTRYIAHRKEFAEKNGIPLPCPEHCCWTDSINRIYTLSGEIEKHPEIDYVIIDTPGTASETAMQAMALADILVTPLNDSLVDLDVLATLDQDTMRIKGSSQFSQTVWTARQQRMLNKKAPLHWVVARNRLLYTKSKNSKVIKDLLEALSRRIHFTLAEGISERVIYREMFVKGLTMMDFKENGLNMPLSVSSVMARQEIRSLMSKILQNPLQQMRKDAITA